MISTYRLMGVVIAGILPALVAWGSGTRVNFKDAFAIGRGNAFTATADNPSALYYNPAGITQLEGHQVSSTLYAVSLKSEYTDPAGGPDGDMDDPFVVVPQVYYTFSPANSPWSFGFAVYAPFGLQTEWPDDVFRSVSMKAKEEFITLAPTVAYQLSPTLSVAGTLTYNRLNLDLRRGVLAPGDEFRYQGDDEDISFNLGVLWQPTAKHSFGLTYHHKTSFNTKGTADTVPYVVGTESASARIDYPEVIIAGYSFRPTPQWNFEVNIDWQNWDRRNDVTINKGSGPAVLPFEWNSGFLYEVGGTRYFSNGYRVSAGYIYAEDSSPEKTYLPAIPDADRHFVSVGVGYSGVSWDFDIAFQHAFSSTRTVNGSPVSLAGDSADGKYRNTVDSVAISAGYRF